LNRRDQIIGEQSAQRRREMQNGGGGGFHTGVGAGLDQPNFSADGALTILSDTRGYDFGSYLNGVLNKVRTNWYAQMPESVRLGIAKGRVMIDFTITHDGTVQDLMVRLNSGLDPLDKAAVGSITQSNPFQKLPAGFDGDMLRLRFAYYYNIKP
jgi:TonB family protein